VILLALVSVAVVSALSVTSDTAQFEEFKKMFNKKYSTPAEELHRFTIFKQSLIELRQLQARTPGVFGETGFMDMTAAERSRYTAGKVVVNTSGTRSLEVAPKKSMSAVSVSGDRSDVADPLSFYYTRVTNIKDQGNCGSCWAFAISSCTEVLWANMFPTKTPYPSFAPQEFVSCYAHNCNGNNVGSAMNWWQHSAPNARLIDWGSYPYVSGNGQVPACKITANPWAWAVLNSYNQVGVFETDLLNHGPIVILIDICNSFYSYTGGIYACDCNLNNAGDKHYITVIGYDNNAGHVPYWIVKNSWGSTNWGTKNAHGAGYIFMQKGINTCNIDQQATWLQLR